MYMKILHGYFFLLPFLNMQTEGHYERHNQFCGGIYSTDINWYLDIQENNIYSLQITAKKNEYLSKPKTTFITGTWQIQADTIKLSSWGKEGNLLVFYKKDERLLFQSNKSNFTSRDLVYLDYLEKTMQ